VGVAVGTGAGTGEGVKVGVMPSPESAAATGRPARNVRENNVTITRLIMLTVVSILALLIATSFYHKVVS
jgi:hypothetical protein